MRRVVVVAPGVLSKLGDHSFIERGLQGFSRMGQYARLRRVPRLPRTVTPEAMLLGMGPNQVQMAEGPLTVAGLGFDPPERSTHFHLSLLTFDGDRARLPNFAPRPGEVQTLMAAAKRLDSKLLTTLVGEEYDHALVWEALGDLGTVPASELANSDLRSMLPDGDGDVLLRRYIDDSINLLSEHEVNLRRADEGLPPINLLWPWGHGVRVSVPNLALRRGEPAKVESASLRLQGLSRLAGYRHVDRRVFGKGVKTKFAEILKRLQGEGAYLVFIDAFQELRASGLEEELGWLVHEFDKSFLEPLLRDAILSHSRLTVVLPPPLRAGEGDLLASSDEGISADFFPGRLVTRELPFDERLLEDRQVPAVDAWDAIGQGLLVES